MSNDGTRVQITADDQTAGAFNAVEGRLKKLEGTSKESSQSMATVFRSLGLGVSVAGATMVVRQAVETADAYTRMASQLRLVSESSEAAEAAQAALFRVAQGTNQEIENSVSTYVALARSTEQMNISQDRLLRLTETINKAYALTNANAETAGRATVQLGQAFAGGSLRAEEWNSIIDSTPAVLEALATGLDTTVGELRKMMLAGELTSERMIEGFEKAGTSVDESFSKITPTVENAFTKMSNSVGRLVDKINDATGAGRILAGTLTALSRGIDAATGAADRELIQAKIKILEDRIAKDEATLNSGRFFGGSGSRSLAERRVAAARAEVDELRKSLDGLGQSGGAAASVADAVSGPAQAYIDLSTRLAGVSKDFHKHLQVLHAEYQRGGIGLDEYREKVAKLIETETKREKTKKPKGRDVNEELRNEIESMQRRAALVGVNTEAERVLYDVTKGRFAAANESLKVELKRAAALTDAKEAEEALAKVIEAAIRRDEQRAEALQQQVDAWLDMIDPLREFIRNVEKVEDALGKGLLTPAQAEEIKKRFASLGEELSAIDEFALEAARNIQDALGQGLFDIMDGKFKNIGDAFANLMKRMAAEAMAANLANAMFGDFGKTGKVGGLFGDGIKWLGSLFGGPRAAGGPVSGGTSYLVGEKGPELFVPRQSGSIVPNDTLRGGSPNIVINSTVNPAPGVTMAQFQVALDASNQALKAELLDGLRRGRYQGAS
ncbi:MAG TPA: tape measure protein [Burkholderiaceae bacterium]|nr:tape measure protein [Burkholderiaceae bacterium]